MGSIAEIGLKEAVFESYTLASAAGVINLEVPLASFNKALRSALNSTSAQVRLTKKGTTPFLAFTIVRSSWTAPRNALGVVSEVEGGGTTDYAMQAVSGHSATPTDTSTMMVGTAATGIEAAATIATGTNLSQTGPRERETVITQEVPVRVLNVTDVEGLHEPRCEEPDVHIILPTLSHLKSISERFTKLALGTDIGNPSGLGSGGFSTPSLKAPKLELSANMRGSMKLAIANDTLRISSVWSGLVNPAIDPSQLSQEALENLPSERMRQRAAEDPDDEACWAKVKIDGRDWGRVLSVGRLSPRVVASESH
ncbi:hypothetical protein KEM54_001600 [Ascosphaera aggregata]|nr:hypothetical protein KEM54_001600 [Ascosphaera aggregata]